MFGLCESPWIALSGTLAAITFMNGAKSYFTSPPKALTTESSGFPLKPINTSTLFGAAREYGTRETTRIKRTEKTTALFLISKKQSLQSLINIWQHLFLQKYTSCDLCTKNLEQTKKKSSQPVCKD